MILPSSLASPRCRCRSLLICIQEITRIKIIKAVTAVLLRNAKAEATTRAAPAAADAVSQPRSKDITKKLGKKTKMKKKLQLPSRQVRLRVKSAQCHCESESLLETGRVSSEKLLEGSLPTGMEGVNMPGPSYDVQVS